MRLLWGTMADPRKQGALGAFLLSICFPALAFFLEGTFGLITGLTAVVVWWGLALPRRVIWGLSVLFLAAAPFVLIVQGLPKTNVVGAGFGVEHLLAHRLVVLSLVLAALAALSDLLNIDPSRRRRRSGEPLG